LPCKSTVACSIARHRASTFEDEWFIVDNFALTGGLRYDNNQDFDGQFSPRLYGVWNATETVTVKGGVGRGFRAPFLEQITSGIIGFGDGGSRPLFGNPNLNPERSTNVEFSVLYDDRRALQAQATIFRNELKDKIERGTGANRGIDVNIGESVIQGVIQSDATTAWPVPAACFSARCQ
jgi:outer membrane receptor for ferrienterochelin and colicins